MRRIQPMSAEDAWFWANRASYAASRKTVHTLRHDPAQRSTGRGNASRSFALPRLLLRWLA